MRFAYLALVCLLGCTTPTGSVTSELTSPSISTNSATYSPGAAVGVSWFRLPGNAHDWIAIAPAGSPATTVSSWVYTNGAIDGTASFTASSPGSYVARAFLDDSYTILSESPFAVTGVTVTRDRAAYVAGAPITVTWAGLPGLSGDWIGLAPEGSAPTTVNTWVYTGGAPSGSHVFALGTPGRFVARAFANDSYELAGESAAFTNGVTITTDLTGYEAGESITVDWALLPGNQHDWIAISPQGSPPTTITTWVYANGAANGSHVFSGLFDGTYVARAYVDDSYDLIVESAPFVVGIAPPPPQGTISVALSTIGWGQDITVTWSNFPGNVKDWIALAPAGSPAANITRWIYTNGATSGSYTFDGGVPTVGNYVARGFLDDSSDMIAESAVFVAQETCVGSASSPFDENYTGIGQNANIVVAPTQVGVTQVFPCLEEAASLSVQEGCPSCPTRPLDTLSAPRLRTLTGALDVHTTSSVSLPRLTTVGGTITFTDFMDSVDIAVPSLVSAHSLAMRVRSLSAPQLTTLQGSVDIRVFTALDLGLLSAVPGTCTINAGTATPSAPALQTIGGTATINGGSMSGFPALETIFGNATIGAATTGGLPALERIYGNALLTSGTTAEFPALVRIDGEARIRAQEIVMPVVVYMYDFISNGTGGNPPFLHTLQMPSLQQVEHLFQVQSNPQLSTCAVNAIVAQLSPPPNFVSVSQNGPCPP